MTTGNSSSEKVFKYVGPLFADYDDNTEMLGCVSHSQKQITVFEADLDIEKARALRDWLNEVLP